MPKRTADLAYTTAERGARHDSLMPLLEAMYREFKELSKKKPDGALNKKKVDLVNRLLKDILTILEDEPNRPYLDLLDEEDLPQNSDVLLMLSQFEAAMRAFHDRYWYYDSTESEWKWSTK
jgi:hypothetical protein